MKRSMMPTREANEDQVEIAGMNDQGDWHVPKRFWSTNDGSQPPDKYQRFTRQWYP